MLPGLVALILLARTARSRILLMTPDAAVGGSEPELLLPARLPPHARRIIEPLVVREWDGFHVCYRKRRVHRREPVVLADPVQLWMDLLDVLEPAGMVTGAMDIGYAGNAVRCHSMTANASHIIDLRPWTSSFQRSDIVEPTFTDRLLFPVLADFDMAGPGWNAMQYAPIGDGRILLRKMAFDQLPLRPPPRHGHLRTFIARMHAIYDLLSGL